jgi:hypothetical protein
VDTGGGKKPTPCASLKGAELSPFYVGLGLQLHRVGNTGEGRGRPTFPLERKGGGLQPSQTGCGIHYLWRPASNGQFFGFFALFLLCFEKLFLELNQNTNQFIFSFFQTHFFSYPNKFLDVVPRDGTFQFFFFFFF